MQWFGFVVFSSRLVPSFLVADYGSKASKGCLLYIFLVLDGAPLPYFTLHYKPRWRALLRDEWVEKHWRYLNKYAHAQDL